MSSAIVEACGLTVTLGGRRTLGPIDLRLDAAHAVAVVGRSGAGKSVLAQALLGLLPGLSGSLRCDGTELVGAPSSAWLPLRRVMQLCWQDPLAAMDPWLRVVDAIHEARCLAGLPRWDDDDTAMLDLCRRVALDPPLRLRWPGALSGGQRQRAALARALAAGPQVLIADEITSAVDRPVAWELVNLLRELRPTGLGLLWISHDLSLLPGLVDDVVVLEQGLVVERGPTSQVLTAPQHPVTQALCAAVPRLPRTW